MSAKAVEVGPVDPAGFRRSAPGPVSAWQRHAAWLDRGEVLLLGGLWLWMLQRMTAVHSPMALLPLASETLVLALVLVRRSAGAFSVRPFDWLVAVVGTCAPLLVVPVVEKASQLTTLGVLLVVAGSLGQMAAKLTLRRSFGIAPANRGVKVGGLYAFVRHPIYAGYVLMHVGVLIVLPSWINLGIYAIGWAALLRRIVAEEAVLGQDETYRAYAARVRWRLLPGAF